MREEITLTLILLVVIITAIVLGGLYDFDRQQNISQTAVSGKDARVTVAVYNGTQRGQIAQNLANALVNNGFDVRRVANTENKPYSKTLVYSQKSEDLKTAEKIASLLHVENSFFLESDADAVNDITIILGDSYKEIK